MDDSFALKQTGSGSVSVTGFKVSPTGDDSDADDEDRQEIEFWGLTVPAKKKGSVKLNDDADERIHITQARSLGSAPSRHHAQQLRYIIGQGAQASSPLSRYPLSFLGPQRTRTCRRFCTAQIALGPKAKNGSQAVVTIAVDGGRKAILGTLDADKNPHFEARARRSQTPLIRQQRLPRAHAYPLPREPRA